MPKVSPPCVFHIRSDTHAPLAPDHAICDFSTWNKARNTRIKFGTGTRIIQTEKRNELILK